MKHLKSLIAKQLVCLFSVVPVAVMASTTVFNDDFSTGSTLNSLTPAAPTANSTSYEMFSSKTWVPAPTMVANDLKFGIAATTSGHVEVQALFSSAPISLSTVGDYINLRVTFNNTLGLFSTSGHVGFGLYNSGGVGPLAGGMNATAVSGTLGVTGGAQGWQGYVSRIATSPGNNRIAVRPAQSITTGNNQDVLVEGSGSQSYAGNVNLASVASTLSITAGTQLTEDYKITLSGAGTYLIESKLYQGPDTSGLNLLTQSGTATGANFFNNFDALAIGWRATANTTATTIDIASITVITEIAPVPEPTVAALMGVGIMALIGARRNRR